MTQMKESREKYDNLLKEAKLEAEKILVADAPEVDAHTQKLFDLALGNTKGAVMFAATSQTAVDALGKLVAAANEPALARQIKSDFMQLSQQVLASVSGGNTFEIRKQLASIYDTLQTKSEVGDTAGARAALRDIQYMQSTHFAVGMVQDTLMEISKDTARYANEPARYFEAKASFIEEVAKEL
ncbi:hypothetical protein [Bacillus rhizoplanae]|uniref:hypothetical protein n=1 Tax=Bacillus rhizoplanae TaxID=2880966 RepID=UPI003D1DD768